MFRIKFQIRFWLASLILFAAAGGVWAAEKAAVEEKAVKQAAAPWEPLALRWDGVKAAMTTPIENLTLPLEHHPNGRVKVRLHAKLAQIFDEGDTIFAETIRVELLTDQGKPDGELKADGCLFDRKTKCGYCKGRVFMKKDGDQIKGQGLFFSSEREFIKILGSCEIRTHRFQESFGRI